ncbi:hypothetical protein B0T11DRAFT_293166 [Plectosphaerella cucumerina]|uniref:Uncharacterized protein n=1 Tax=Plectosphaerella cucumerina TaxID=40658 RepID=A0A8K0TRU1_9PEZI|nr:hypothetical protein B0T11DRAFT_293166 [Plectosphaerella cucumerina]
MTSSSPKAPARSFPSRRPCPVLAPGCEGDKRRPQDWSSRRQLVEKIVGRCGVPSSEVCRFHVEAALAADEVFGLLARPTRRPRVSITLTASERLCILGFFVGFPSVSSYREADEAFAPAMLVWSGTLFSIETPHRKVQKAILDHPPNALWICPRPPSLRTTAGPLSLISLPPMHTHTSTIRAAQRKGKRFIGDMHAASCVVTIGRVNPQISFSPGQLERRRVWALGFDRPSTRVARLTATSTGPLPGDKPGSGGRSY